jgi:hypothetical protein
MSLHTLAQHLQSAGRGDDTVLVHMTPGEVSGLQSLAMAHGGSLTINPETGLPEAGFLRAILPMVAGAFLGPAGIGLASSALQAGLMVGAVGTAATGSLGKGLMMGLGAYGGAGLAEGLIGAGAASSSKAGAGLGMSAYTKPEAFAASATRGAAGTAGTAGAAGAAGTAGVNVPPGLQAATTTGYATPTTSTLAPAGAVTNPASGQLIAGNINYGGQGMVNPVPYGGAAPPPTPSVLSSVKEGVSGAYDRASNTLGKLFSGSKEDEAFRKEWLEKYKNPLIAGGVGTLAMYKPKQPGAPEEAPYEYTPFDYVRPYNPSAIEPGSSKERGYFRAADGGLATLPVENMSRQNALMDNNRYPMAFQQTPTYANPSERPIAQNVIYPSTDASVSPYSGAPGMASGGVVALANGGPTPQQIAAGQTAYAAQEKLINSTVKPFDIDSIAEPKGGWTNTNVYATYAPLLTKERNELMALRGQLPQYLDAKGEPKPGFEDVVGLLQNAIAGQTDDLTQAVETVYGKIPRTDPNFEDPKKAAAITAAQTNEEAQINALLANFVNNVPTVPGIPGLAGSEFAKEIKARLDAETAQKQEAAIFQTNIVPVLTGVTGEPKPADSIKLVNAMVAAGLIDKEGKTTAKGEQFSGVAGFAKDTLQAYQEGEKSLARSRETSAARAPTFETKMTAEGSGWVSQAINALPPKVGAVTNATQGWNTTARNLTAADVTSVFEEVVGRKPTAAELQQYVGNRASLQGFADAIGGTALDHLTARSKPFTADEIQAQAKYYWGREMDDGELAGFIKGVNAGSYPTFAHLRNALTGHVDRNGKNSYQLNLQNQLDLATKPPPTGPTPVEIADVYGEVLGRKPTKAEYDAAVSGKTPVAALRTNLLNSTEYLEKRIYQPEAQPSGVGGSGFAVQQPGAGAPSTTTGIGTLPGTTPISGGTGFTSAPTAPRVKTPEEIAADQAYMQAYASYTPTGGGIARPVMDEKMQQDIATVAGNIYRPQFLPAAETPDIRFIRDVTGQAFPYRDPNKELGLTGLYSQLSQKMPDLRQGLTFTPSQGAVLAAPFSNVTPGLITLQSAAAPQAYTPPTPVLPGTTTQTVALTPEEQMLMAQAQNLQQNRTATMAAGGYAGGGYHLGDYSDGGRLLKGPGDGVSDSIPASIGNRQPARLADGEFVIPARIVSELGNGSTDAGARQLYAMMERIQKRRGKTVGKGKVAVDSKSRSLLPA